ncbi:hypothetical protein AG4045_030435 [Apium graveolens]|uniref:Uncharacterized protein n=1 Tax=Apium graveolens TaxID=4045 RepID=A0A6L5B818_APIGR|nr:hypothetical protein AG4045_030435 [Apium graveolens]
MGNILFVSGVMLTIGLQSSLQFFMKRSNYKWFLAYTSSFCAEDTNYRLGVPTAIYQIGPTPDNCKCNFTFTRIRSVRSVYLNYMEVKRFMRRSCRSQGNDEWRNSGFHRRRKPSPVVTFFSWYKALRLEMHRVYTDSLGDLDASQTLHSAAQLG